MSKQQTEKKTALALGYFDGLHCGHIAVLKATVAAAETFDAEPAVLTFDMSSLRAAGKGGGDLLPRGDLLPLLTALGIRQCITLEFSEIAPMSGLEFVRDVLAGRYNAACVCCGADFRFGRGRECGINELQEYGEALGIAVQVVPDVFDEGQPVSTTRIKAALATGDTAAVTRMLGRAYGFSLPVFRNKGLARKLGFPTVNQLLPEDALPPRFGVYHTRVEADGVWYDGVSSIGIRPTFAPEGGVILETHILNYSGNLYGKTVRVEFCEFLRPEKKFADVEQLRKAVLDDIDMVKMLVQQSGDTPRAGL